MSRGPLFSAEEQDFFRQFGISTGWKKGMAKEVIKNYWQNFPKSTRPAVAIVTKYYRLKHYEHNKPFSLPVRHKPQSRRTTLPKPKNHLNNLELSAVKADVIDNLLIDLTDEIARIKKENATLRAENEHLKKAKGNEENLQTVVNLLQKITAEQTTKPQEEK